MRLLFADFETYWAQDYTLRSMTPAQYILDPRFQVHGCAFQEDDGEPYWVEGSKLPAFFQALSKDITVITFNALFDMCIVAWRYDYVPAMMLDVMGMARACIGPNMLRSFSLASVSAHHGLGEKGTAVLDTKGLRTEDMDADLYQRLADYACHDVRLTAASYKRLRPQFPVREARFMDMVLRCAVTPKLQFNADLLCTHLSELRVRKAELLRASGAERTTLMSTQQFADLLRRYSVLVETKVSPTTGNIIPALAKTDEFMQSLVEHDDERVRVLASARLAHKSTIDETRTERLLRIAELPGLVGAPIPLRYGGAHTHRLSGDWKINLQNLPRGSTLRRALVAPPGHVVAAADSAQIEARLNAWFCREKLLLSQFALKRDPYAELAMQIFQRKITKKDNPVERFIGKTGILGAGYGCGARKFHTMVHTQARVQLGHDIDFSEQMAEHTIKTYRTMYPNIPNTWYTLNTVGVRALARKPEKSAEPGVVFTLRPVQIKTGRIILPSGLALHYDVRYEPAVDMYVNHTAQGNSKMYGAKLLENIIQALARIIISEAALRLGSVGLPFVMQVHDELVFVVRQTELDEAMELIKLEMTTAPEWAPNLPLDVEIHAGESYGDTK